MSSVNREELKRRADGIEGAGKTMDEVVTKLSTTSLLVMIEGSREMEGEILSLNMVFPDVRTWTVESFIDDLYA